MKKKNLITAVGAGVVGAGAASYFLMNDNQKSKVKEKFGKLMNNKEQGSVAHTFEKAGQPDQIDQTDISDHENAKMVSEGSQFGVQYYNEKQSDEAPLQ